MPGSLQKKHFRRKCDARRETAGGARYASHAGENVQHNHADYHYADHNEHPDPSHRPMYLAKATKHLRADGSITTILDAGCGGGDFAQGLACNGYTVYGIDLSASGVTAAQARRCGSFAVSSVYDDLLKPFTLRQVDAVITIEVIEHLYDPRLFVARAREALKPSGLLIVTTPYWGYLKNILLAITNRTDRALEEKES